MNRIFNTQTIPIVFRISKLLRTIGCVVKTTGKRRQSRGVDETPPVEMQLHATLRPPVTKTPKKEPKTPKDEMKSTPVKNKKNELNEEPTEQVTPTSKRQKIKTEPVD